MEIPVIEPEEFSYKHCGFPYRIRAFIYLNDKDALAVFYKREVLEVVAPFIMQR